MTITLHDPVRPLDQRPRLPQPEDDAVGDRRTLPPFRDQLHQQPAMRVSVTTDSGTKSSSRD